MTSQPDGPALSLPMVGRAAGVIACLLGVVMLSACNFAPKTSDLDIEMIERDQVARMLANSSEPVALIDVRSPEQFAQHHLPGAINIPLGELRRQDPRLTEARQLIVYGDGPGDPRSPAAAKTLIGMGFRNVHDYRGGIEAWE